MLTIRPSTAEDGPRILAIWRGAVDATHDFLRPDDRRALDEEVADFLPLAPNLLACNDEGRALGFMLFDGQYMEALFIDPAYRGKGIGRLLVEHALTRIPNLFTDVNEQNLQAIGFYLHLGFVPIGRSPKDADGRPYPLIHLRYPGPLAE